MHMSKTILTVVAGALNCQIARQSLVALNIYTAVSCTDIQVLSFVYILETIDAFVWVYICVCTYRHLIVSWLSNKVLIYFNFKFNCSFSTPTTRIATANLAAS